MTRTHMRIDHSVRRIAGSPGVAGGRTGGPESFPEARRITAGCPRLLVLVLVLVLPEAGGQTFTSPATLGPYDPSINGGNVVVRGCTLTLNGPQNINSLTVEMNGVVTHDPGFASGGTRGLHLTVATFVRVEAGSSIDVLGRGHGPDQGPTPGGSPPGVSYGYLSGGGGGGHGGPGAHGMGEWGLPAPTGAGGGTSGVADDPMEFGSGGQFAGNAGGWGGGRIRLDVAGTATIDGTLRADGGAAAAGGVNEFRGGGGAGGTVIVTAGVLEGGGVISAKGGNGVNRGGGGGGGRLVLHYGFATFAGPVTAQGGGGASGFAAPGTLLVRQAAAPLFHLLLDNGNQAAVASTDLPAALLFASTVVFGGTRLRIGSAAYCGGDLLVQGPGTVVILDSDLVVGGSARITNGALVTHDGVGTGAPFSPLVPPHLVVGDDLLIDASSTVDLVGKGHRNGQGPGAGTATPSAQGNGYAGSKGAGHGGAGGNSIDWGCQPIYPHPQYGNGGGFPYGTMFPPYGFGSGGGVSATHAGHGGGAIRISVGDTFTQEGAILADGQDAPIWNGNPNVYTCYGGGGSGGSVWIEAGTYTGYGILGVRGGAGSFNSGGGGGGRIGVRSCSPVSGNVTMYIGGGAGGTNHPGGYLPPWQLCSADPGLDGTVFVGGAPSVQIVRQPANLAVCAGTSAVFTIGATGALQWRRNGAALSNSSNIWGADGPVLVIRSVSAADVGTYDCAVTTACGSAISAGASLVVSLPNLSLALTQPGGPGSGLLVSNAGLIPGCDYFNVFSIEPCPGGPGTGPYLGLCASNPFSLLFQLLIPPGTPPSHFLATSSTSVAGPIPLPPGLHLQGLCLDLAAGTLNAFSPVADLIVQ